MNSLNRTNGSGLTTITRGTVVLLQHGFVLVDAPDETHLQIQKEKSLYSSAAVQQTCDMASTLTSDIK